MNIGNFPMDCLQDSKNKLSNIIEHNKKDLEALLNKGGFTYKNFVRQVMDMSEKIGDFFSPISHLQGVKNSEDSQNAFTSCIQLLAAYNTELSHNKRLYDAYLYVKNNEYKSLTKAQQKVLDDAIFAFELEGVALDDDKKNRIKDINIRLSELSDEFSQNVLNATNAYKMKITDETILGDMPQSDKNAAKSEDGWVFTLQMPSYIAFMTYVTDRVKREEMYKAYSSRAPENTGIIDEILKLRDEKAHILGFNNFADMNIQTMSASSATDVINFLRTLASSGKPFALKEKQILEKYAKDDGIDIIEAYDTAYYSEKLKKEKYSYDEEELRPYFEKNMVVKGLFDFIYSQFGVKFVKKDKKLWDDKAEYYELYENDALIGGIYIDLESRSDKRGGAWMDDWHSHFMDSKDMLHLPEVFVVCNFPVSSGDNSSFLRHSDVTTLFHEMGHAIHHLFSKVDELDVSGVNGVDWDTVEFPSQFLENFAYSKEVLNMIAEHYETGESIPDDLLDKVYAARNFQAGMALVRQLEFGLFDMLIHTRLMTSCEVQKTLDDVRNEVAVIIPPRYNIFQNGFNHIFSGGYAAGYYSYKWAEMLSSDAYCAFMEKGVLDKELAHRYKDTVLSLGSSMKMNNIYNMFLKREPKPESILALCGLV